MVSLNKWLYYFWIALTGILFLFMYIDRNNNRSSDNLLLEYSDAQIESFGTSDPSLLNQEIFSIKNELEHQKKTCEVPAPNPEPIECIEKETDILCPTPRRVVEQSDDSSFVSEYTVYFNLNGGGWRPDIRAIIRNAQKCEEKRAMKEQRPISKIEVYGFADKFGSTQRNIELLGERAQLIASALSGFPPFNNAEISINSDFNLQCSSTCFCPTSDTGNSYNKSLAEPECRKVLFNITR